jgi:drug/metabolite transporter (DMT)-like permease
MKSLESISKSDARKVIAAFSMIALIIFLVLIFTCEIPDNNKDLAYVVGGAFIGSCISSVYNYFFGSSQGSADKQMELREKRNEH